VKVSDIYKRCVPFISPSEFRELDIEEVNLLLEGIERYYEPVLYSLRINGYICAQCHSKKKMKAADLYAFPWETDREKPAESLSREQVLERARQFERNIKKC
jgi:hypothetical protein